MKRRLLSLFAVLTLVGALTGAGTVAALAGITGQQAPAGEDTCENLLDIKTGYYRGGNSQPSSNIVGLESLTQYRSLADGSIWPGYQKGWITALPAGTQLSYAIELRHYGAPNTGPQTINGKAVPAPAMHIQRRSGTTFPLAYGYDQMVTGQLDPLLDRALSQLKSLVAQRPDLQYNWQIASEFDTDHEFGTDEAGISYTWAESDVRAVRAIQYLINYLRDNGLPEQVTFTVGMAGIWRDPWVRMHPPSLAWLIDGGIQYNAYNHSVPSREPYTVFSMTKAWTVQYLSKKWQALPIVIQEWGTPSSQGDQATWLSKVPAAIAKMNSEPGPRVERLNYFDSNDPWGTFIPRVPGEQAWSRMAADPIFEPCATVLPSSPASQSPSPSQIPSPSPSVTVTLTPTPTMPPPTVSEDPTPDEPEPTRTTDAPEPEPSQTSATPPPCSG